MSNVPRMAFLNSSAASHSGLFERLVQGLFGLDYAVYHQNKPVEERLSVVSATVSFEQKFAIDAKNKTHGLELTIEGGWGEKWLERPKRLWIHGVTYQSAWFRRDAEEAPVYSNHLLQVGQLIYNISQAEFGWIDITELAGRFWFDDVEQCKVHAAHWATFVGAAYIRRCGGIAADSRTHTAISKLVDGGVLYIRSGHL